MTPEEAIKNLKNIVEYWTYKPTEVESAKMAISALEKQIPKKPKEIHRSTFEQYEPSYAVCECGENLVMQSPYCRYCGQRLDWRNEDER